MTHKFLVNISRDQKRSSIRAQRDTGILFCISSSVCSGGLPDVILFCKLQGLMKMVQD
jgi:hypothetical protein